MPAVRLFALVAGVVYVLVGLLGFTGLVALDETGMGAVGMGLREGLPRHSAGYLLGLFPVNMIHSIVHVLIGLWGCLAFAHKTIGAARSYALGLAVIYLLLAVLGMIPFSNPGTNSPSSTFGLIPLHGHDVWLHALTGAVAAFVYFSSKADRTTVVTPAR
jgi:hypothetical protein